jgi:hypothetical protein
MSATDVEERKDLCAVDRSGPLLRDRGGSTDGEGDVILPIAISDWRANDAEGVAGRKRLALIVTMSTPLVDFGARTYIRFE